MYQTYLDRECDEATHLLRGGLGGAGGRHACCPSCWLLACLLNGGDDDMDKQRFGRPKEVNVALVDGKVVDKEWY
jgi:hypothetical protein